MAQPAEDFRGSGCSGSSIHHCRACPSRAGTSLSFLVFYQHFGLAANFESLNPNGHLLSRLLSNVQVLNGAIAAALFNLLYDVVLSQKVKWFAMCPVVDFLNHKSSVQVTPHPHHRVLYSVY